MKGTLKFGHGDSRKTFNSKDEIREFLVSEQNSWREYFNTQNQHPIVSIKNDLNSQYAHTIQLADQITDDKTFNTKLTQIEKKYQDNLLLRFDGKRAKYAFSIAKTDEKLQYYLIGYFTNKLYNQGNDPYAYRGIFEGLKYQDGINSNIDAEKASLESLKDEWDGNLSEIKSDFQSTNSEILRIKSEIEQYFIDKKEEFNAFKKEKVNEFDTIIKAYDDKLALQAPVNYWNNKSTLNYGVAGFLGIVFFIVIWIIIANFEPLAKDVSQGIVDKNYYPLIQFSSITIITIWLLRIIVKIFYSKLHLAEEAREKEMFIKTYLSMLRETDAVKDDSDRHLILQSIFSPSKNGIIKDDGLPTNIIENIIRARS